MSVSLLSCVVGCLSGMDSIPFDQISLIHSRSPLCPFMSRSMPRFGGLGLGLGLSAYAYVEWVRVRSTAYAYVG